MAVTIIATAGASDANSYETLVEYAAYMDGRLNAGAFHTDAESQKRSLVEATREIDTLVWVGRRATTTQALAWPRERAESPDAPVGVLYYDNDVVPERVKVATSELALEFLRAGTTDLASLPKGGDVVRRKVDVFETEWAHPSARARGIARFPRVMQAIGPLLAFGALGQVRLVR